jgi:DNA-binding beta-propeller fold protein YncE
VVVAGLALALASTAAAGTGHRYVGQFGSSGSGAGDLSFITGIGVDGAVGNLYVTDEGNSRVQVYTAGGDPIQQIGGSGTPAGYFSGLNGVAIDAANNRLYVPEQWNSVVDVFATSGAYVGQLDASLTPAMAFSTPSAVAVDPSNGNVYVADTGNNVIDVFDVTGAYVTTFGSAGSGDGEFSNPNGIAVDSASNVYVVDAWNNRVEKFTALGAAFSGVLSVNEPTAISVDRANDDVYVGQNGPNGYEVARFSASGTLLETFGGGRIGYPAGVATSPSTHRVYVADGSSTTVEIFAAYTTPDVTTGGVSGITSTDATFDGTVNPQGVQSSYHFDYGVDSSYGNATSDVDAGNGTSDVAASADATGLQPNATYHYRLVATTASGNANGADATFTTAAAAPTVDGTPAYATEITSGGATLHAAVNPNNSPTSYHFEYGTDTSYGSTTTDGDAGSGSGDADASSAITGLQPETTYHFRLVADNGTGGDVMSADQAFATGPAGAPTATDVTAVAATLTGTLNPQGAATTYHFEYGTDTSYGSTTGEANAGSTAGDKTVSADVTDLTPGTTYHVRLVSTRDGHTTLSDDATFTTAAAPEVTSGEATDIGASSATLHGTVDTHGQAGTYRFMVTGVGNPVSRMTPQQPVSGTGPVAVSAAIADLPNEGTFEVRLVATAGGAHVLGDAVTFTTAKATVLPPRTPTTDAAPYGCANPHLDQPSLPASAGKAYTLTGSDLGVGGRLSINGTTGPPADAWSAGAVTFTVPDDAHGTFTVAVNCGTASNVVTATIPVTIPVPPSNAFTIVSATTKGSIATVTVKVPGRGVLTARGNRLRSAQKTATRAGTITIRLSLTKAGLKALRRSKRGVLRADCIVSYTPASGRIATHHHTLTFKPEARK